MHLRRSILLLLTLLLTACGSAPTRSPLATWTPSPNHNARQPQLIVLHHTEQSSVAQSLRTLRTANSGGRVSAHYLVGRDGDIHQLVGDLDRAWHAGVGQWRGMGDLNSSSIGIELDNNGSAPFPPAQMDALVALLADLCERLSIPRTAVIAHADLAPARKRDPSRHFPWQALAQAGFGVWPDPADGPAPAGFDAWLGLRAFGYAMDDRDAAVGAFHRRFRGRDDLPAELDAEDARILHSLLRQSR